MSVTDLQQARTAILALMAMAGPSYPGWRIPSERVEQLSVAFLKRDTEALRELSVYPNRLLMLVAEQLLIALHGPVEEVEQAARSSQPKHESNVDHDEFDW